MCAMKAKEAVINAAIINLDNGAPAVIDLPTLYKFIGFGNEWGYKQFMSEFDHKLISISITHKTREQKASKSKVGPFGVKMGTTTRREVYKSKITARYDHMENFYKKLSKFYPDHFNVDSPVEIEELVSKNASGDICVWTRIGINNNNINSGRQTTHNKLVLSKFKGQDTNSYFKGKTIQEAIKEVGEKVSGRICQLRRDLPVRVRTVCEVIHE